MKFRIEYDKQPPAFLKRLDKHVAERILDKLDNVLSATPIP